MQSHCLDVDLGIVSNRLPDQVKGREQEGPRQNGSKLRYLERISTHLVKFVVNNLLICFIVTDGSNAPEYGRDSI